MSEQPQKPAARLGLPLGLVLWGLAALVVLGVLAWLMMTGQLTWTMAVEARETALAFVARYPAVSYALYISCFVAMALVLLPVQLWTIVFGSMVFGFWPAVFASWFACVLGALAVFVAARGAFSERYHRAIAKYLGRIEKEFLRDQFSWMLTLRFIPVIPYCIGNVAPVFLGARGVPFLLATIIGVLPYVLVYAYAGDRAASALSVDTPPDLGKLAGDMFPAMLAMAAAPVLALLVRWQMRRGKPAV